VGGVVNLISRRPSRSGGHFEGHHEWLGGVPGHSAGVAADWVSDQRDTSLALFGKSDKVRPLDITGDAPVEPAGFAGPRIPRPAGFRRGFGTSLRWSRMTTH
jgi:hypothetical protein